ncbi:MAG: hypothetical protein ACM3S2_11825 [Ignavibacteriales bacterium]
MPASSILLVGADAVGAEAIHRVLSGAGYSLDSVGAADEALRTAHDHHLVVIDVLPEDSGAVDLCREIRSTPTLASIPVLCVSGTDDVEEQ